MKNSKKLYKSKKSKKLVQKPLKDGSLTTMTLVNETKVTETKITWRVENYNRICSGFSIEAMKRRFNCYCHLILWEQLPKLKFLIAFSDDFISDVSIKFSRSNGEVLKSDFIGKTRNFYSAEIDVTQFSTPSEKLTNDILFIECSYTARPHETTFYLTPRLKHYNELSFDENAIFSDLKDMYLSGRFYDFILRCRDAEFKVHKLILCMNSKIFADTLKKYPDWKGDFYSLDEKTHVMHGILLYFYSGELKFLDDDNVWEVYNIARKLKLSNLQAICVHFLQSKPFVNRLDNADTVFSVFSYLAE